VNNSLVIFQVIAGVASVLLSVMLLRFRGQLRKEIHDTSVWSSAMRDDELRLELSRISAAAARMSQQRAEENYNADQEIQRISGGM